MELVFDLWADRGAYPDHGGGPQGALGQPVVGPLGLVDTLETMMGLGAPPTAHVVRVAHFQAILESIAGAHFWSRSLATDPWATARIVLSWRDELVGFGWRAEDDWFEPRLSSLAQASRAAARSSAAIASGSAIHLPRSSTPIRRSIRARRHRSRSPRI